MFRSTRTIALIRSLVFGSAAVTTTVLGASSLLISCADDSKPEYWIDKLDDKAWRPRAIARLSQFYEDALTKADRDPSAPEVKGLLDEMVEPLTNIYVNEYANLDEKTRENLINLLASLKDERTEPALKVAFEEFGKRGRGGKDVKWASRAVRDMKLKSVSPAVFAAFKKTQPSTKEGAYYRDLNEALLAVADPSWSSELIAMLEQDFPSAEARKKDPNMVSEYKDKVYQTITAAQVLGETGSAAAVKPLMKVILDPAKADAANESLLALTKIGKPAVEASVALLQDKDKELAEYMQRRIQKVTGAKAPPGGTPHVSSAAVILGALGRPEAIQPVISALENAKEDADKVQFLSTLSMLPHTPQVKAAFVKGLESISADARVGGASALQALSEPATLFFDPAIANLLVSKAGELKDDKVGKSMLALAAIKIMDASNVRAVGSLVKGLEEKENDALKKHLEKVQTGYDQASKLLEACKKDVKCYTSEATKSENQGDKTQLIGVKALYMVGIHGDPSAAAGLVDVMGSLNEGSLRYVASQVIDHHYPQGSEELAKKLEAIVEKNKKSMDTEKASMDKPLRDAVYRLRARAS